MTELGKWIKERYGAQQALADALGLQQARISKWLNLAEPVPPAYQEKMRKAGYKGPWPREEAKEPPAPPGGPYATASEVAELRGALRAHVEQWERGTEKLLERLEALARKVDRLAEGGR